MPCRNIFKTYHRKVPTSGALTAWSKVTRRTLVDAVKIDVRTYKLLMHKLCVIFAKSLGTTRRRTAHSTWGTKRLNGAQSVKTASTTQLNAHWTCETNRTIKSIKHRAPTSSLNEISSRTTIPTIVEEATVKVDTPTKGIGTQTNNNNVQSLDDTLVWRTIICSKTVPGKTKLIWNFVVIVESVIIHWKIVQ